MSNYEDENYKNVLLGEAVIELLFDKVPITNASLLWKLYTYLLSEDKKFNEAAVRYVIDEVTSSILANGHMQKNDALIHSGFTHLH